MKYLKLLVLTILGVLCCNDSYAYDFEVDGMYYNILSNNSVEITYRDKNGGSYSGELVIPNSVEYGGKVYDVVSIGEYAFYKCRYLTGTLTIPNSVTSIKRHAFNDCSGFTGSLTIPSSVISIESYAFNSCGGFTGSLTIPSSVTSIGESAFNGCSGFTGSLIIPNSVTSINYNAFSGCSGFTGSLTIPSSVTSIGNSAFSGCSGFTGSLTIPSSVTSIGNSAFSGCRGFTGSLTIPSSVTSIGNSAFNGCSGFTGSLTIPSSVTSIESYAFADCSGFTDSLTIPGFVTFIGAGAFRRCGGFTGSLTIPSSVTSIGSYAFYDCSGFKGSLTIPSSVTSIESYAFAYCSGFTGSLTIPSSVISIESYAFNGCGGFTGSLTIPSSVTSIGESAFSGCSGFTGSLIIPNSVTSIRYNAFRGCSGFTGSLAIPGSVTSIESHVFYGCSGFTGSLTIPSSVTMIENGAFTYCSGFELVISKILSPFNISNDVFYNLNAVLQVPKGTKSKYQALNGWIRNFKEIREEGESTHVLSITASANGFVSFNGTEVRGATSTFNVIEGTSATVSFTPDEGYHIASVKVNNTDVTSSVVNNQYTINNVTSDLSVNVVFESNRFEVNSIYYNILSSNSVEIAYCKSNYSGELIIPNSVEYNGKVYDVVSIGEEAFENCSGLTGSLTIPSSVTKIGDYAFHGCSGLTGSLTIPNSVTSIGEGAFYNCRGLTGSLTIPSSVTSIRFIAFCGCSGFTGSLTIPNSVTSIGESAFSRCSGLTGSLIIPSSVKSIGEEAFAECRFTGSLTIPNSVVSIGKSAFYQCNGFTGSLTIPNSLTSIGHRAFIGCSGFELVISEILSPSNISNETFLLYNPNAVLQVPKGTKSKYQALNGWICNFKEIREEGEEENITALDAEGVNYMVVSQTERTIQVAAGDYGQVLTVPATVSAQGLTWQVTGIEKDALKDNANLAAVIWEPEVAFTATVSNPNLLLYVKDEQYAQSDVKNVVVNGTANSVVLVEAAAGNSFYCPQAFTAHQISYTHNYQMQTGIGEAKGWETLALPFDVQSITHQEKGNIVPFASRNGSEERPFWLYELTGSGFVEAGSIKAYTPYIISMPNHPQYYDQWLLRGNVTFTASDVIVGVTNDVRTATYGDRTFVPCFTEKGSNEGLYAMNVNNDYVVNSSGMTEGSKFVLNMRSIHPFEAYMTTTSANPQYSFGIFDGMPTKVGALEVGDLVKDETYYDLQGRKTIAPTKRGVYITNGRKKVIK